MALDMETGQVIWSTNLNAFGAGDNGCVHAFDGYVFTHAYPKDPPDREHIYALNATTGDKLWEYKPEGNLQNFMPLITGDGSRTFIFQNNNGTTFRMTYDGKLIWQAGGIPG